MITPSIDIYHVAWSAFLYAVTYNTNAIIIDLNTKNNILLKIYFDREPTDEEKEVYYSVCTEFEAKRDETCEVEFIVEKLTPNYLGELILEDSFLFFARCDYVDNAGNVMS